MGLQGEPYREQNNRSTQRVLLDGKAFFVKQHFGIGWKEIVKNLLQFKLPILSAKNEWRALQRLEELGVPTLKLTAYGARGLNPARMQSFLLTEELAPATSLEELCQAWPQQPPAFSFKLKLLRKLAQIARTLHENNINHRDFYLCHFLFQGTETQFELYLIDLHRAGLHQNLRSRWIIKDLAGLYFSSKDIGLNQRDLWRFMKAYRQRPLRAILLEEDEFWEAVKTRGEKLYAAHLHPN